MSLSERQQKDFHWFLDNYSELSKKYGDSYLVIKDQAVIGVYPSYAEGVELTAKNEKMGSFIVQHCNGKESGYTNYITSLLIQGEQYGKVKTIY